jgi:small subunit ribosomal protein S13
LEERKTSEKERTEETSEKERNKKRKSEASNKKENDCPKIPSPALLNFRWFSGVYMKKKSEKEIPKEIKKDGKEIRGIVRIAGRDLRGDLPLKRALSRIKGIGIRTSHIISEVIFNQMILSEATVVGELSDEQIEQIEGILVNPVKYGVPSYMLNRRKDLETGQDRHMLGTDLSFAMKQDIEKEKTVNSWKGYRHMYGQKVRGQRTRSSGRTGMSVGVLRKSIIAKAGGSAAAAPAAAAAAPAAKKEEPKKEATK